MPQFSVYKDKNPKTRSAYPYLVDVQSDLAAIAAGDLGVPVASAIEHRNEVVKALDFLITGI